MHTLILLSLLSLAVEMTVPPVARHSCYLQEQREFPSDSHESLLWLLCRGSGPLGRVSPGNFNLHGGRQSRARYRYFYVMFYIAFSY
jgi:hypothetical protein